MECLRGVPGLRGTATGCNICASQDRFADPRGARNAIADAWAEATLLEQGSRAVADRGSLTAAETGRIAAHVSAQVLVLTHMWEELGFAAYRAQAARIFPRRIEMASPGLTISS